MNPEDLKQKYEQERKKKKETDATGTINDDNSIIAGIGSVISTVLDTIISDIDFSDIDFDI